MQSPAAASTDPAAGISHRIVAVRVDGPGAGLFLSFQDGVSGRIDLLPLARPNCVTEPFADAGFFAQVKIGPRGRSLEWPGDIELCADSLRLLLRA